MNKIIYANNEIPSFIIKSVLVKSQDESELLEIIKELNFLNYRGTIFSNMIDKNNKNTVNNDYEKMVDVVIDSNSSNYKKEIIKAVQSPVIRRNAGEVYIPSYIWETEQFKNWYKYLLIANNVLDKAELLYTYKTPSGFVFAFVMKVSIWVEKEKRFKSNEIIISRRNISSIIAHTDNEIVLIKEFRSTVSNDEGFVYELPGGSSFDDTINPVDNAQSEFYEEVGLFIEDKKRFNFVSNRQILSTFSTHHAFLFSIKLTEDEMQKIKQIGKDKVDKTDQINDSDEHTYTIVVKKEEILKLPLDYTTIGMISCI